MKYYSINIKTDFPKLRFYGSPNNMSASKDYKFISIGNYDYPLYAYNLDGHYYESFTDTLIGNVDINYEVEPKEVFENIKKLEKTNDRYKYRTIISKALGKKRVR